VVTRRTAFHPFGDESGRTGSAPDDGEAISFIGERRDDETGLIYLNAPFYDPVLGRFISPDTMMPNEPRVGTNRYAFALNDPINRQDRKGHEAEKGDEGKSPSDFDTGRPDGFGLAAQGGAAVGFAGSLAQNAQDALDALLAPIPEEQRRALEVVEDNAWQFAREIVSRLGQLLFGSRQQPAPPQQQTQSRPGFTIAPDIDSKIPQNWGPGRPTRTEGGWRWGDPRNPNNSVRMDPGRPDSGWPTQRQDHVVVNSNGRVIGRDGNPIQGTIAQNYDQAHIPLSEWRGWTSWNRP